MKILDSIRVITKINATKCAERPFGRIKLLAIFASDQCHIAPGSPPSRSGTWRRVAQFLEPSQYETYCLVVTKTLKFQTEEKKRTSLHKHRLRFRRRHPIIALIYMGRLSPQFRP